MDKIRQWINDHQNETNDVYYEKMNEVKKSISFSSIILKELEDNISEKNVINIYLYFLNKEINDQNIKNKKIEYLGKKTIFTVETTSYIFSKISKDKDKKKILKKFEETPNRLIENNDFYNINESENIQFLYIFQLIFFQMMNIMKLIMLKKLKK